VEFRILGPLEVVDETGPVALGTVKERVVLGVLLLHANEVVSRDHLIDEVWGDAPPATARKAVNVYVSQLRKALARSGSDPIETVSDGYRVAVEPHQLDATRFERLLTIAGERASAGDPAAAADFYRQALRLWRGRPLAGLEFESVGRHQVAQWEEQRVTALMDRIDSDLALGRHEQLVGELKRLVAEHPLRERLRGQQMLALYRAGRQAEALDAYQEARQALVEELGIEPSAALQRLQRGILEHDPALEVPTGTRGPTPPGDGREGSAARPARAPRRRSRRALLVAAAALLAASAGTAVIVFTEGSGGRAPVSFRPRVVGLKENSLIRIDPASGAIVAHTPSGVGPGPISLALFPGPRFLALRALWVVDRAHQVVSARRFDGGLLESIRIPGAYDVAAMPAGGAWVSETKPSVALIEHLTSARTVAAVSPRLVTVHVPGPAAGAVAVGGGFLWVIPGPIATGKAAARVSLVSTRTHRLAASVPLKGETTTIAYGDGAAWIGIYDPGSGSSWVAVLRPGAAKPRYVRVGSGDGWGPLAIGIGGTGVWVLTSEGALIELGTELRPVRTFRLAAYEPRDVAASPSAVWVLNGSDFSLSEFNASASHLIKRIRLGSYSRVLCGIAATSEAVWATVGESSCR
jgi:DNA-binding SARP family transcriptional activator